MWKRTEIRTQENVRIRYEFPQEDAEGVMSASSSEAPSIFFNYISINRNLDEAYTVSSISVGYKQSESFESCVKKCDTSDWNAPKCHPDFIGKKEQSAMISICRLLVTTESRIDWHRGKIRLNRLGPDYAIELFALLRFVNEHSVAMDAEMCRQLYIDSGAKRPSSLIYCEIQSVANENVKSAETLAISYQNDGYIDAVYFLAEHIAAIHNIATAFETYMMVPRSSAYYRDAQAKCCIITLEKLASENTGRDLKDKYEQQLLSFALNCGNNQLATSCFAKLSGKPAGEPETPIALDAHTIVSLALEARALRLEIQKIQSIQRVRPFPEHEVASSTDSSSSSTRFFKDNSEKKPLQKQPQQTEEIKLPQAIPRTSQQAAQQRAAQQRAAELQRETTLRVEAQRAQQIARAAQR